MKLGGEVSNYKIENIGPIKDHADDDDNDLPYELGSESVRITRPSQSFPKPKEESKQVQIPIT